MSEHPTTINASKCDACGHLVFPSETLTNVQADHRDDQIGEGFTDETIEVCSLCVEAGCGVWIQYRGAYGVETLIREMTPL